MSRIDELVRKLCPDGVEYKALGEVTDIKGGRDYKHLGEGNIPVYGSGGIMTYVDTPAANGPTVLLPRKGSISNVFYVEGPFWNVDTIFYTDIHTDVMHPRFLYHVILSKHIERLNTSNAARPALTRTVLSKIRIPVPPMEVQEEIVRVLDSFAELEARKTQYAFYRDRLLDFGDADTHASSTPVRWVTLGEVGTFTRGSGLQKKDFVDEGVPCIHYGQIHTHYGLSTTETISFVTPEKAESLKKAQPNDVLIAITSEDVEACCKAMVWLGDEPVAIGGHETAYSTELNPKYVAYWFQTEAFYNQKKRYAHGTKVIEMNPRDLAKIRLPVPPMEEQHRIVDILDRFDALTTSLTDGIPAEIEARRAQYAYYRDKLLAFPEKA